MASNSITFTQVSPLSGTSYAWSAASNWVGDTVPAPGQAAIIPDDSPGVSYDNVSYSLTAPLLDIHVGSGSVVEIALGTTLDADAIYNLGTVVVDVGAQLANTTFGRLASNDLMEVAGTLGIQYFLNMSSSTFAYEGPSADIYVHQADATGTILSDHVENFGVGDGLFLAAYDLTVYPEYVASVSGTDLLVDGFDESGRLHQVYEMINFGTATGVTGIDATVVSAIDPVTGITGNFLELSAVCFVAGTRIATERGETAVEELREGDLVLTVSCGRRTAHPIRWIGERRLDLTTHARPELLFPIRIRRGALGENVPQRDLLVSPDHCLFLDGELIPAKLLVNGMTIVQDRAMPVVHYYHVELDNHDVLLAEGVPAESYLNTGNRGFFATTDGPLTLHPELEIDAERTRWQDRLCAPLRLHSTEIERTWERLAARAEALGYRRPSPAVTADPDLRLVASGREFRPVAVEDDRYVFVLPSSVSDIRIASRSGVPVVANRHADDWRRLGVAVGRIGIRVGDERFDIPADHPALMQGWHPAERDAAGLRRWTDGNAALPLALSTRDGAATVEIHLAGTTPYPVDEETAARLAA